MKQDITNYKVITIEGGDVAISYLPEIPDNGTKAVIDLNFLMRLNAAANARLSSGSIQDIAYTFSAKIRDSEPKTMDEYLKLLKDEYTFYYTSKKILLTDIEEATEAVMQAEEAHTAKEDI